MKKHLRTFAALTALALSHSPAFASNTDLGIDLFIYDQSAQTAESGTVVLKLCDAATGGACYCSTATEALDNGSVSTALNCSASDIANLPNTSFMQIEVNGELLASPEIQAVPYSLFSARSAEAETLAPGNVTIQGDLIVTGSVTSSSITGGGSANSITGIVAGAGLMGGGTSGNVTLSSVLGSSIESSEITDGNVTSNDLADNSVTTSKISAKAVTLGVKTTGNYVESVSAGSGILTTGAPSGEGIAHTISVNSGNGPNQIVQLDSSGRLPAVNGSLLTNLTIPTNSVSGNSIVDDSIASADIGTDLDFMNFSNAMTLDADTSIATNGHNLSFRLGVGDLFAIYHPDGITAAQAFSLGGVIFNNPTGTPLLSITANNLRMNLDTSQWTERLCHSGGDGATDYQFVGDCNSAGQADLAEHYGSDGSLSAGDVVIFDGSGVMYEGKDGKIQSKASVAKADQAYDDRVMGVISTNPFSEILGQGTFEDSESPVPLALVGRVPVNVTTKNGAIHKGDYLTSSDIPGFAMRATQEGAVIGMALEDFDESQGNLGQVLMFIKTGHWAPPSSSSDLKNLGNQKGRIVFARGEESVHVTLPYEITSQAAITATPLNNPQSFYWVEKDKNAFTIRLAKAAEAPVSFDWILIP